MVCSLLVVEVVGDDVAVARAGCAVATEALALQGLDGFAEDRIGVDLVVEVLFELGDDPAAVVLVA
jgi:hypothetical protein